MSAKNPRRPRPPLTARDSEFVSYNDGLWRIYRTTGPYRQRWNQMRTWGPVDSRWDPHPEPPAEQPDSAVLYAATDTTTAFGEAFQERRAITLSGSRALVGWTAARTLRLLDLTSTWAVRSLDHPDLATIVLDAPGQLDWSIRKV